MDDKQEFAVVNPHLRAYVEREILPRYDHHDAAHRRDHALMVISQSMSLVESLQARGEEVDANMAFAIAAYHDTGLCEGREVHHLASGRILRADAELSRWFTPGQIEVMAQAVEDHRASADHAPRSIYGRIVAEADRMIVPESIVRRTIQYGLDHYAHLSRQEHYLRTKQHLREKYGEGGYLKLWFPESPNVARLEALRALIKKEDALHALFDEIFTSLTEQSTP